MSARAGALFRSLVARSNHGKAGTPLQILGAVNPYCALLAKDAGAEALYLSGSGVATASFGMPDLGITNLNDVTEDIRRITAVCDIPLLVDVDTGFGGAFGIARAVRELERAGAAAMHIEDQAAEKRCGHRPGKQIVSIQEMVDRIKTAVDARTDENFVIMARTDALASEGIDSALERSQAYLDAGADMLFPEALTSLEQYARFHGALPDLPLLANITEFGQTELFSREQLGEHGVSMVLYPLSAHRAMAKAAHTVYSSILDKGHQRDVVPLMQTRDDLYRVLEYHKFEDTLDRLFQDKK